MRTVGKLVVLLVGTLLNGEYQLLFKNSLQK